MVGWHHQLSVMSLRKLWEIWEDREAWHAAVHMVTKNQTMTATEKQSVSVCVCVWLLLFCFTIENRQHHRKNNINI